MSLTLFCNDKRRKYLDTNKPVGRVGHSLHNYYELSSTDVISNFSLKEKGHPREDTDLLDERGQVDEVKQIRTPYAYTLNSSLDPNGENGRDEESHINNGKYEDHINRETEMWEKEEISRKLENANGEKKEEGRNKRGDTQNMGKQCKEENLKGMEVSLEYCKNGENFLRNNNELCDKQDKVKKEHNNMLTYGKHKVVLFGGALLEEEFVNNYSNGYLQSKDEEDEDVNNVKRNMMLMENYLHKTFNDVYICEEENNDFEYWTKVKTHNVPEPRAFHASCIVNLGLDGVFLFIHGGKVKNNKLANNRLCALNLSKISVRRAGMRSDNSSARTSHHASGEYTRADQSDTTSISSACEEIKSPKQRSTKYRRGECESDRLVYANFREENQSSCFNKTVIKDDWDENGKNSENEKNNNNGKPANEPPESHPGESQAEEGNYEKSFIHKSSVCMNVEKDKDNAEVSLVTSEKRDVDGGGEKWNNNKHFTGKSSNCIDSPTTTATATATTTTATKFCHKEESSNDIKANVPQLGNVPQETNVLLNNKKRKRTSSSSYLFSASNISVSSASALVTSSSSSSSSNSLPPCNSRFFRSNMYIHENNQFNNEVEEEEADEEEDDDDDHVLVNSRVPVKSLLMQENSLSCSSASSEDNTDDGDDSSSLKKVKRMWVHIKTAGKKPNNRYGHTLDFLYPHLILFGGNENIYDEENLFFKNDLWVLNINKCKTKYDKNRKKVLYFSWQEIEYQTIDPLGRYFHATTIWYDRENNVNNLILYGGKMKNRTSISNRLLSLQNNGNNWYWSILPVYVDPINENRSCHSLACSNNYIFIIGGEEYKYRYIEKMPSAVYSFKNKKFQYINEYSAKACLKCFIKNETIYSWGGFTDVSCNNNFMPSNFVTININPHIVCIQMKEDLGDDFDDNNNNLFLKEDVDSDDNIYNRMNKKIVKIQNKKMELEKDLLYQIKLNDNLNLRIKSQMHHYQKLVQLLNVKQLQNSHLLSMFKRQSVSAEGATVSDYTGVCDGLTYIQGLHLSHSEDHGLSYDAVQPMPYGISQSSYQNLPCQSLYEGNQRLSINTVNHSSFNRNSNNLSSNNLSSNNLSNNNLSSNNLNSNNLSSNNLNSNNLSSNNLSSNNLNSNNLNSNNLSSNNNCKHCNSADFKMIINEQENVMNHSRADIMNMATNELNNQYECSVIRQNSEMKNTLSELSMENVGTYKNMASNENIQSIPYTNSKNEKESRNIENNEFSQLQHEGVETIPTTSIFGMKNNEEDEMVHKVDENFRNVGNNSPNHHHHNDKQYNNYNQHHHNNNQHHHQHLPFEQIGNNDLINSQCPTSCSMHETVILDKDGIPSSEHKNNNYFNGFDCIFNGKYNSLDLLTNNNNIFIYDHCMTNLDQLINSPQIIASNNTMCNSSSTNRDVIYNEKEVSSVNYGNNENSQVQTESSSNAQRMTSNQRVRRKTAEKCLQLIEQDRLSRIMSEK
ncbi:hypothetical protein, conserved [Plasmodium gonderi]|uniref:Kelch domain-containing protein n=1 Tax=Plasmodium gonderi TaxID=77519 RepID=A0A1Y1JKL9_PLAGO|nr:hypothetical protein, conserved [Plasmodium gonderi]GAW82840.1 hypothetical protein, conserved [Plasmodium gonderi]